MTDIRDMAGSEDLEEVKRLFTEYATWLADDFGISLEFQGFEEEFASLPGKYAPPRGALLLYGGQGCEAQGCVALRPISEDMCEIKRLYVRPNARGAGIGKRLALAILDRARALGYRRALLDTGAWMKAAQAIYEAQGFRDTEPYYDNPYKNIRFMALDL